MSQKSAVMFGLTVGSIVGSFIPMLWGADFLSFWPVITSTIGAIIGVYVMYKLTM